MRTRRPFSEGFVRLLLPLLLLLQHAPLVNMQMGAEYDYVAENKRGGGRGTRGDYFYQTNGATDYDSHLVDYDGPLTLADTDDAASYGGGSDDSVAAWPQNDLRYFSDLPRNHIVRQLRPQLSDSPDETDEESELRDFMGDVASSSTTCGPDEIEVPPSTTTARQPGGKVTSSTTCGPDEIEVHPSTPSPHQQGGKVNASTTCGPDEIEVPPSTRAHQPGAQMTPSTTCGPDEIEVPHSTPRQQGHQVTEDICDSINGASSTSTTSGPEEIEVHTSTSPRMGHFGALPGSYLDIEGQTENCTESQSTDHYPQSTSPEWFSHTESTTWPGWNQPSSQSSPSWSNTEWSSSSPETSSSSSHLAPSSEAPMNTLTTTSSSSSSSEGYIESTSNSTNATSSPESTTAVAPIVNSTTTTVSNETSSSTSTIPSTSVSTIPSTSVSTTPSTSVSTTSTTTLTPLTTPPQSGPNFASAGDKTNELNQMIQHLYVAQARVQLEATEIKKAQGFANAAQTQLEEATNKVRAITSALQAAQQEVASSAIRAQTAQLLLDAHDQLLFAARQDVDALSAHVVGLQVMEGISAPQMNFDVNALIQRLQQPLNEQEKPTPVPPLMPMPPNVKRPLVLDNDVSDDSLKDPGGSQWEYPLKDY